MGTFRTARMISTAALTAAMVGVPMFSTSGIETHLAICPNGMIPNPTSYGCVPEMPGRGAPSEEVVTRCDGNYFICIWPYPVP